MSSYFSALVSHENGDDELAIKYFNSTKSIIRNYPIYFDRYIKSLVLENNVEKAICIGTDKAVSPLNTYGATKLLMEKLFVTASNYLNSERHKTKFIAVRYGNVLGSSGSVIPKFIDQIRHNHIKFTKDLNLNCSILNDKFKILDSLSKSIILNKDNPKFKEKMKTFKRIKSLKDIKLKYKESMVIQDGIILLERLKNKDRL